MNAPTCPLQQLAATQSQPKLFAFDRCTARRELAGLQKIYTTKVAQLDTLRDLFNECAPVLVVRGDSGEVALNLRESVYEVYPALREALENILLGLEKQMAEVALQMETEGATASGDAVAERARG